VIVGITIPPAATNNIVIPAVNNLILQQFYQMQTSSELKNWTNQVSPFSATNVNMMYPRNYYPSNRSQLYFRVQVAP
jgi:hypothetical protein